MFLNLLYIVGPKRHLAAQFIYITCRFVFNIGERARVIFHRLVTILLKKLGLRIPPPSEHDWRSGKWRALDAWRAGALDAMRVDQGAVLM